MVLKSLRRAIELITLNRGCAQSLCAFNSAKGEIKTLDYNHHSL